MWLWDRSFCLVEPSVTFGLLRKPSVGRDSGPRICDMSERGECRLESGGRWLVLVIENLLLAILSWAAWYSLITNNVKHLLELQLHDDQEADRNLITLMLLRLKTATQRAGNNKERKAFIQ